MFILNTLILFPRPSPFSPILKTQSSMHLGPQYFLCLEGTLIQIGKFKKEKKKVIKIVDNSLFEFPPLRERKRPICT